MAKKAYLDYDRYKNVRKNNMQREKDMKARYKDRLDNFKDNISVPIEKHPLPLPVDRKTFAAFAKYENVEFKKEKVDRKRKGKFIN